MKHSNRSIMKILLNKTPKGVMLRITPEGVMIGITPNGLMSIFKFIFKGLLQTISEVLHIQRIIRFALSRIFLVLTKVNNFLYQKINITFTYNE